MRFHDSPPVTRSKKLSTKLFRLYSDESIISYRMILNRYSLFCVYIFSTTSYNLSFYLIKKALTFLRLMPFWLIIISFCNFHHVPVNFHQGVLCYLQHLLCPDTNFSEVANSFRPLSATNFR